MAGSGWRGKGGKGGGKSSAKSRRSRYQNLKSKSPRKLSMRGKGRRGDDNYIPF